MPGLIFGLPFALFLQFLSERERKKALAGSKVKISANDVVASYKILCAFVIFPLQSMIFKGLVELDQFLFKIKFFRLFAWSVLVIAKKN